MQWVLGYICLLIVFGAIDLAWLSTMGPALYRPVLSGILASQVRFGPAIGFYLAYPLGLLILALGPALRSGAPGRAAFYGAVLGAVAYATYDLTNYATLRIWSLQITLIDIVYGAAASCIAAVLAFYIVNALIGSGASS